MTIQFTLTDTADRLDRDEQARRKALEKLAGCPVVKVIDGTCQGPGCNSTSIQVNGVLLDDETCARLKTLSLSAQPTPQPVIQTEPRLRCVL